MLTIASDARSVRRAHRMQVVVIGMSIGFIVFVTLLHIVGKVSCASTPSTSHQLHTAVVVNSMLTAVHLAPFFLLQIRGL